MSIKSAVCFILIFVLLLSVFSLSALAYNKPPKLPVVTTSTVATDGITFNLQGGTYTVGASTETPVYCCYGAGDSAAFYLVSQTQNAGYTYDRNGSFGSRRCSTLHNATGLYYNVEMYVSAKNPDIPSYSSLDAAMAAVLDSIQNPEAPDVPIPLSYSLPPGNAIYIQVSTGASYTLRTRMPESVLGSNHYPGNNQAITLVSSLPSGGTAPTSPLIPWQQDGALSVLGLSRNAVYNGTNASAGYLCIVNPLYYSGTANGPYEFLSNGSIDITIDNQSGFVVYPLDSTLGFTSGLGINVDTEILDTPFTGGIDPETGEIIWEDSNGGSTAPTTGGGNLVSTSETIFDFLRNIGDEIATFLKGPIQAIQTVVSAIREFLGSFTQLYMWLPAPVYNLITSALMIALTIGVIKIFV